jgi:hypothetical protein
MVVGFPAGKEMRSEVCGMEGVSVATQEPGSGSSTGLQMNNAAGLQQQQGGSLTGSASVGSSGSEDSGGQLGRGDHSPPPPTALTWQQQQQQPPYVGAVPPPLPMSLAQAKVENILGRGEFNSHNAQMLGKRFREDEEGLLHENHSGITVRPAEFHESALQSWLVKTSLMLFCANFHVIYGGKLRNVVVLLCGREVDLHQLPQVKDFQDRHNRDCQRLVSDPVSEHGVVKPLIHIALQSG